MTSNFSSNSSVSVWRILGKIQENKTVGKIFDRKDYASHFTIKIKIEREQDKRHNVPIKRRQYFTLGSINWETNSL